MARSGRSVIFATTGRREDTGVHVRTANVIDERQLSSSITAFITDPLIDIDRRNRFSHVRLTPARKKEKKKEKRERDAPTSFTVAIRLRSAKGKAVTSEGVISRARVYVSEVKPRDQTRVALHLVVVCRWPRATRRVLSCASSFSRSIRRKRRVMLAVTARR